MRASVGITDEADSSTTSSARPQRNPTYRPSSKNNRHKHLNLPSFSFAHTHCQQKSGSSSAAPTPGYTPYPSFPPIPAGLAHWAILIGLSVVRGKSRPRRPGWYGMSAKDCASIDTAHQDRHSGNLIAYTRCALPA